MHPLIHVDIAHGLGSGIEVLILVLITCCANFYVVDGDTVPMEKLARDKEDIYMQVLLWCKSKPQWFRGLRLGLISEAAEVGGITRLSLLLANSTCPDKLTCTPMMCWVLIPLLR